MAAASIFRANFPTFHRLVLPLLTNALREKETTFCEPPRAPIQILVMSHKLEETDNGATAPRLHVREGSAGPDEP